jgi:transcriptional regulator with XRE-family HTH domain
MRVRKVERKPITELTEYIRKGGYDTNKAFAARLGIEAPTLSMITTKKVLPIRPMMALICDLLHIEPLQVWERYELDLLGNYNRPYGTKGRSRVRRWRVEANIGRELYKALKQKLKEKGVSVTTWIITKAMEELTGERRTEE